MKTIRIFCIAIVLQATLIAQNEFANWHFGSYAGLNFNSSPPSLLTNTLIIGEGCASISDANGNVLFYTDGVTVINSQNALIAKVS